MSSPWVVEVEVARFPTASVRPEAELAVSCQLVEEVWVLWVSLGMNVLRVVLVVNLLLVLRLPVVEALRLEELEALLEVVVLRHLVSRVPKLEVRPGLKRSVKLSRGRNRMRQS